MKRSSLFISSLCFLFIFSSSFATTCPSVEKINSTLEKFEVYLNGGSTEKGTSFMKKCENNTTPCFYYSMVDRFKGAYYQKETENVKKSSLTCMYTLKARNTYFDLKLRDVDADTVDITSFNKKYWNDSYNHGLYSCENNLKGVSVKNCSFTLNNK